jgi:hypothetical protein
MTESEWESATSPWPLRNHLTDLDLLTVRKKALFAVACCRRIVYLIRDERSLRAIETCEAWADGDTDFEEFCDVSVEAFAAARELEQNGSRGEEQLAASAAKWLSPDDSKLFRAAEFAGEAIGFQALCRSGLVSPVTPLNEALAYWRHPTFLGAKATEETAQAELIREMQRNPFRNVAFQESWLTSTVLALARQIYQDSDYSLLPILADALQDAGCDSGDVLNHCRDPQQVHVRGCWVVDLVLGRN